MSKLRNALFALLFTLSLVLGGLMAATPTEARSAAWGAPIVEPTPTPKAPDQAWTG